MKKIKYAVSAEFLNEGTCFLRKRYKQFGASSVWVCEFLSYDYYRETWIIVAHNYVNPARKITIDAYDVVYVLDGWCEK